MQELLQVGGDAMKKSPAYKIGEELCKVGVRARRKVDGYSSGKPATLKYLRENARSLFAARIAIGEYVEKHFRRVKCPTTSSFGSRRKK